MPFIVPNMQKHLEGNLQEEREKSDALRLHLREAARLLRNWKAELDIHGKETGPLDDWLEETDALLEAK